MPSADELASESSPALSNAEFQKGCLFLPKAEFPRESLFPQGSLGPGSQPKNEGSNNIAPVGAAVETLVAPASAATVGKFENEAVTEVATRIRYLEFAAYVNEMFASVTARLDAVERRFYKDIVFKASGDSEAHSQKLIPDGYQEVTENLQLMYTEAFRVRHISILDDTVAKLSEALDSVKNCWKEDSQRLWEAIDSHTHDLDVDGSEQSDSQSAQGADNGSNFDLIQVNLALNRKLGSGSALEQDGESLSSLPASTPQDGLAQPEKKSEDHEPSSITVPSSQIHVHRLQSAPISSVQPAPGAKRSGSFKIPMDIPLRGSYRVIPGVIKGGSAQLAPAGTVAVPPLSSTGASQAMLGAKALVDKQALLGAPASALSMVGVASITKSPPISVPGSAKYPLRAPQWPPVVATGQANSYPGSRVSWKLPNLLIDGCNEVNYVSSGYNQCVDGSIIADKCLAA